MPYATTNDHTRIYYTIKGSGAPLLMIMGQGLDHSAWGSLLEEYAQHFRVIAYDHRGTGKSDKPEFPPYSTRGFASDAVAVLDAASVERAHVFGISMGGRIAQWLAIDYAQRVAAMVLACTTPGNAHGIARPKWVDILFATGNRRKLKDLMVSPEWAATNQEFEALWREQTENPPPTHTQKLHYLASQGHNCWDELQLIRAPTLLIHGSDDVVNVPENSDLLQQGIKGSKKIIIPSGKHFFFFEHRQQTKTALLDFLTAHKITV